MTAMTDEGDDKVGGAGGGEIKDESAISAIASLLSINNCVTVELQYWSTGRQ